MNKFEFKNELIKRKYFIYLRESGGFSENSIDSVEDAILLWQDFSKENDFGNFSKKKVIDFKDWLKNKKKKNGNDNLGVKYRYHVLIKLRKFFVWLALQSGYKSKINITLVDFLKLSKKESRMATEPTTRPKPTMDEVKQVIVNIKPKNDVDRRDRALLSLAIMTGARISALVSLPIQSFDKTDSTLYQDPNYGVKTKFSKNIVSKLIPIGGNELRNIFLEWFDYLVNDRKFDLRDPIFPATKIAHGKDSINFCSTGEIENKFWTESTSARKVFERRFKEANIRYYHPHSFRHLIVAEVMKMSLTEEQKKAISQNLGHEHVATTFGNYGYGKIDTKKQLDLVAGIDFEGKSRNVDEMSNEELIKIIGKRMN